jgi:D-alanyl-D-alanine carboxypeptidase (penicillin-binding protein 5/6)
MNHFCTLCTTLVLAGASIANPTLPLANSGPKVATTAPFALIMDYHTGGVLFAKNATLPMPPSSMTKLVTILILFDAVRKGTFSWDTPLIISPNAAKQEGSRMMLIPQQQVQLEDLLKGVIVCSGNDASTAFAESYSGSEEEFAKHMNHVARDIGATQSHFMNASGLPHPQHKTTCMDLAKIARYLIYNFPEYYHYFSIKEYTFNKIRQWTRNLMVRRGLADGMKTGKTEAGGYGIVISAERHHQRFIVVLNGTKSEAERFQQASTLLNWAFTHFASVCVLKEKDVLKRIPVHSTQQRVGLISPVPIAVCIPRSKLKASKVQIVHYNTVHAPVKKGQLLGEVRFIIPGQEKKIFGLYADRDAVLDSWWRKILHRITP